MATKFKTIYVCGECGYESPKWNGRCPSCGNYNTMSEEIKNNDITVSPSSVSEVIKADSIDEITINEEIRFKTGMKEFDRVLGGGIVKGSIVLLSGDPGIGKSTILLQICEYLGKELKILYVSGEESSNQIKYRAVRLEVNTSNLYILCNNNAQAINDYIRKEKPGIVIIDSIQTMEISEIPSAPGSVTQVRECTNLFMHCAKEMDIPIVIVGHVNKDGNIAGPKVLEHIVDCVLYFEGERHLSYRILRAVKNRFGSTNEIGVFEMIDKGLKEVLNPSLALISSKPKNTSGTCISCIMEGTRPILTEVQGLVASSAYGTGRRMSTGFDYNRLNMIIAVLEKRSGYFMSNCDAYVNIVGGIKLDEPAGDLSVALALISSFKDIPVNDKTLAVGEIGLGGELRNISYCEQRIKEADRLGFETIIIPKQNCNNLDRIVGNIKVIGAVDINEAFEFAVQ